jgi:membrane carboxypeptidase/penicillin-binding protein
MALPIWAGFMGRIADEKGDEPFVRPPGMVEKQVCLNSGQLATSNCDSIAVEVFLPDVYPRQICDRHGGELLDLSGFERDFRTLDSDRDGPGDF